MTFPATESADLGQPIEYVTFQNGTETWRYTNSNITEQVGARTFLPLAYKRNEPVYSKDDADGRVKFTVPSNIPIVEFYETLPSSSTSTMQIERQHRNDPDGAIQIVWKGAVASVQREGNFATILGVPLSQLPSQVPRYAYSGLCNWFLFQDRCDLVKTAWRHQDTVTSMESSTILTVNNLRSTAATLALNGGGTLTAQEIDDYWLGGYAENDDGEKRAVYETDVDGVPDRIRILQPFRNMAASDNITVYAGCSRLRDICFRKFDNALNHGGFPDIPIVNPFTAELPPGSGSADRKSFFGN